MFHNFFFLKRLAVELDEALKGRLLAECFTQNKEELILRFSKCNHSCFLLQATLSPSISLLNFPKDYARARKNTLDIFPALLGKACLGVHIYAYERSFKISFSNGHALIFKMHGRNSNILWAEKERIIDIFRKNLTKDFQIIPHGLNKTIELSEKALASHHYHLNEWIPALGKEVKKWGDTHLYSSLTSEKKWAMANELLKKLNHNEISLIDGNPPCISLLLPHEKTTTCAIYAAQWLYQKMTSTLYFEIPKRRLQEKWMRELEKIANYLQKTKEKIASLTDQNKYVEKADTLMANLHAISPHIRKIQLPSVHTSEIIEIRMNDKISPQKNAENYYRKAKNSHKEREALYENIMIHEKKKEALRRKQKELEAIVEPKALSRYLTKYALKEKSSEQRHVPFHRFQKEGWTILVGKNSKSNDELTLKRAKKNDLWLHAKDTPGSHVVIKERSGEKCPHFILEYAASLAAYYSKRKGESLCPVTYTQKKYVRKKKGGVPGQVVVEREKVVMVTPHAGEG